VAKNVPVVQQQIKYIVEFIIFLPLDTLILIMIFFADSIYQQDFLYSRTLALEMLGKILQGIDVGIGRIFYFDARL
jgi:hypothetical protein